MNTLTPNTILKDAVYGVVRFDEKEPAQWDAVKDAVDYPVRIVPAFYKLDEASGEFRSANGQTPTQREREYNLVLVDQYREGDEGFQAIACVSDHYGTVSTKDVYEDFRVQLQEIAQNHRIRKLYVSGNGGAQTLVVQMLNMKSLDGPDNLVMEVRLQTSVDGTRQHSISMSAYNPEGDTSIFVYGGEYNLAAKHTSTIGGRTVNFIPQLVKMIAYWNTVIIPSFNLMYDAKFSRPAAINFLTTVSKEAGMGEQHQSKIAELYKSLAVHTNDKTDSVYRVNYTINQYIDSEMNTAPATQSKFKAAVAKRIAKYVERKTLAA